MDFGHLDEAQQKLSVLVSIDKKTLKLCFQAANMELRCKPQPSVVKLAFLINADAGVLRVQALTDFNRWQIWHGAPGSIIQR
jgi:hypothetical protein